jgi:hypothetical protein
MPSQLAEAHIEAERRLRDVTIAALESIWRGLPSHDKEDVDTWLDQAVAVILLAMRHSVLLTDAYLARALERQPVGIDPQLIIDAIRGDTAPREAYRRPFVTLWSELAEGQRYEDAQRMALDRARGMAAFDIQASMRDTLAAVGEADPNIWGYQRVANPDACEFCLLVNGAQFRTTTPMPLHPWCNCGIEPVIYTRGVANANALEAFNADPTPIPESVVVREHGEMGPVLVSPDHDFTSESDR